MQAANRSAILAVLVVISEPAPVAALRVPRHLRPSRRRAWSATLWPPRQRDEPLNSGELAGLVAAPADEL
jgi:hypothetical protein